MDVTTFAVDLAKQVFQVHGFTSHGERVVARRLSRGRFVRYLAERPERGLVVMEACAAAHHWGRELEALGYRVRLIPPQHVAALRMGNKTDGNDADAIYEASRRPKMRFVAVKSEAQQDVLALHRVRERLVGRRTALINQIRGLLGERGHVYGRRRGVLRRAIPELLCREGALTPVLAELLGELWAEFCELDRRIGELERRLKRLHRASEPCRRLGAIEGVGELTATAVAAAIVDGSAFGSGRQFAASLGLTPREHSSGTYRQLGGITKRGDGYLRKLFIHGGRAAVQAALRGDKDDARSRWIRALVERCGKNKAAVAVANKNARISWALLRRGECYRAAGVALLAA